MSEIGPGASAWTSASSLALPGEDDLGVAAFDGGHDLARGVCGADRAHRQRGAQTEPQELFAILALELRHRVRHNSVARRSIMVGSGARPSERRVRRPKPIRKLH